MQVTVNESFQVEASRDVVWALLSDPQSVVTCVPGAQITEQTGERSYKGAVSMKIGPVVSSFTGDIEIKSLDAKTGELILEGKGRDAKGKGNATMRLVGRLRSLESGHTEVSSSMTLSISGRLAQFGSRLMADVSRRVFAQFVERFREQVETAAEAAKQSQEHVNVLSLAASAIGNLFRRGSK